MPTTKKQKRKVFEKIYLDLCCVFLLQDFSLNSSYSQNCIRWRLIGPESLGKMLIMGSYELCLYVTWTAIKCPFMGVIHL